jgi:hypothetical protein
MSDGSTENIYGFETVTNTSECRREDHFKEHQSEEWLGEVQETTLTGLGVSQLATIVLPELFSPC